MANFQSENFEWFLNSNQNPTNDSMNDPMNAKNDERGVRMRMAKKFYNQMNH